MIETMIEQWKETMIQEKNKTTNLWKPIVNKLQ